MPGRALVEPVPGDPAAVATVDGERLLVVADYHAGIEAGLRYERGVELESAADVRLARIERLLDRTAPDRLLVLGDLVHRIGPPDGTEVDELRTLVETVTARVPMTLVPGNHDGGVADAVAGFDLDLELDRHRDPDADHGTGRDDDPDSDAARFEVVDPAGVRYGPVGFLHGHTWPAPDLLRADVICMGHEHPTVKLEDAVGGSRVERAWLRGRLDPAAFADRVDGAGDSADGRGGDDASPGGRAGDALVARRDESSTSTGTGTGTGTGAGTGTELIVVPAFNDRSGGTWVNVEGQAFLAPFLPAALPDGDLYLLDGTRLGNYRRV
jgi:hypothetical protein